MPGNVKITWDGNNYLRHVRAAAEDALFAGALLCADQAVRNFGRAHGGVPSLPGNPPNSQTGHLRNSVTAVHPRDLGIPLTAAFGTNVKYGRYLEFGASPRGNPYLTIPIHPEAKRASRRGQSARSFRLRFVKTKNAALLVKDVPGRHARMEVWYVLKRQVRIAARPWLLRSVRDVGPRLSQVVNAAFRREMARFKGVGGARGK